MHFNIQKCKFIHVSNVSKADKHCCYTMSGSKSNVVTTLSETDLGVWMANNLKLSMQVEKAVSKANQLLGLIKRSFLYIDQQIMKKLSAAIVRLHLESAILYGILGLRKDIDMLESVLHRAT